MQMKVRPTLLVAEAEPGQALSTRKLVLETAKFNVLTAHSTPEGLEILEQFPNISAAVLADAEEIDCPKLAAAIKAKLPDVPVIFLSPRIGGRCARADHVLSSHEPHTLVELARSLLGDPRRLEAP
jgi:CheY-like chemotaxis protein